MELPLPISAQLDLSEAKLPPIGFSPEKMYLIRHGYHGRDVVLKYSSRPEVYEEGEIYRWLKGKLPVPEVLINQKIVDDYYLLVSYEKGVMMQEDIFSDGKKEGIIRYAKLIRQIHQVDMTGFPFVHDLSYKLAKVKETVARHEAKEQYFEREYQGWSPEKMLARLESLSGFQEDLVFCHGDVCMPNFLYEGHQLTAVLDVSGAGINDRYLDLSIALRTLRYNLEGLGWTLTQADVDLFLRTYDYPFDKQRFEFYLILDELMNG